MCREREHQSSSLIPMKGVLRNTDSAGALENVLNARSQVSPACATIRTEIKLKHAKLSVGRMLSGPNAGRNSGSHMSMSQKFCAPSLQPTAACMAAAIALQHCNAGEYQVRIIFHSNADYRIRRAVAGLKHKHCIRSHKLVWMLMRKRCEQRWQRQCLSAGAPSSGHTTPKSCIHALSKPARPCLLVCKGVYKFFK
jgi:hypothetical protein